MPDTNPSATPGGDDLSGYVPFQDYDLGGASEIESPPLPTGDAAQDASALAEEQQPDAQAQSQARNEPPPAADQPGDQAQPPAAAQTQGATAPKEDDSATNAQAAADTESDPELTPEDNALVNSRPEAERPALKQRLKTARFEDHFTSGKPKAEVAEYLESKFPSDYREFSQSVILRELKADPKRFGAEIFKGDPEAFGAFVVEAYQADKDFWVETITGRQGLTHDSLLATLDREPGISGASALTDGDIENIRWADFEGAEALADKLKAARDAAPSKTDAGTKTQPQQPGEEQPKQEALPPEKVIEQYQTQRRVFNETWEHGISPVTSFIEKKITDRLGAEPTEAEFKDAPLVATLKSIKRNLFIKGQGDGLPNFETGLGKWGQHRKDGSRDFDAAIERVGRYSTRGEKENAVTAANELVPFADAYFDERLRSPIFKHLDDLISLAIEKSDPKTPNENFTPGGANAGSQQQRKPDPVTAFHELAYKEGVD